MEAFLLALITAFIWGFVPFLEKIGLSSVEPTAAYLVRCSGVVIGAVMVICFYSPFPSIGKMGIKPIFFLVLAGVLAGFVAQLVFYKALKTGEISHHSHHKLLPAIHISSRLVISWRGSYPV